MRDNSVDFDGLHLVESIHDNEFVKHVEDLENKRQNNSENFDDDYDEEISSEDEPDSGDDKENCSVCKCQPPEFIYNKCSHYILCATCADILIQGNNLVCVLCRAVNTKSKRVYK